MSEVTKKSTDKVVSLLVGAIDNAKAASVEASRQREVLKKLQLEYERSVNNAPGVIVRAIKDIRGQLVASNRKADLIEMPKEVRHGDLTLKHIGTFQIGSPTVLSIRWVIKPNRDITDGEVICLYSTDNGVTWNEHSAIELSGFNESQAEHAIGSLVIMLFDPSVPQ